MLPDTLFNPCTLNTHRLTLIATERAAEVTGELSLSLCASAFFKYVEGIKEGRNARTRFLEDGCVNLGRQMGVTSSTHARVGGTFRAM